MKDIIRNIDNEIFISPISAYEIQLKVTLGKLKMKKEFSLKEEMIQEVWKELPLDLSSSQRAGELPLEHKDPFDRLLAAQALHHQIPILSADQKLDLFSVHRIW